MSQPAAIQAAVFRALSILNETMAAEREIPAELDAPMVGLDSLAVSNLLVAVEEVVLEDLSVEVVMTDEETLELIMSEETSPLRSVGALVAHVSWLVERALS